MKIDVKPRKLPAQERAKFTVNAIKEAATHILVAQGYEKFTTNKVAERAGVSIGSLYQYFPRKESLIAAIKEDHFAQLRDLMLAAYQQTLDKPLSDVAKAFVLAAFEGHLIAPELHRVLSHELPELGVKEDNNDKDSVRLLVQTMFEQRRDELRADLNIPLAAKMVSKTVEHLVHEAVLFEPELLEIADFSQELVHFIMAYLTQSPSK
ncbi:TetR/AcrR family transcriptional regulator [Litorilituus sediminis]|uniref:TetR/AcrR family transcriptional regulator n=1 Tax=Litorilituus sediminis TaxID=718192 RepID=A0A4V0ZFY7_9GAMM|nr:TetR/AcrR family transcriptional regulator [Litorilituus sediminis]QBG35440.1 TetR/AcrR family transcriptional regulator [Litorilituus sediminis]